MYIAFSGIDGAGKSTQINLLRDRMETEGKKIKVVWARGGYTPFLQFSKDVIRRFRPQSIPKPGQSKEREKTFSNSRIRKIWLTAAILDLVFLYGIYVRSLKVLGYTIIFDRYVEDTALDFKQNFPDEKIWSWWLWKLLLKIKPLPNKHFILLIPTEESQRRSILKNEPFPDSKEVLRFRLTEYKKLLTQSTIFCRIDCDRKIEEIAEEIYTAIYPKTKKVDIDAV